MPHLSQKPEGENSNSLQRKKRGPKKGEGGRPRIEIDWELVDRLCRRQCTQEEVAAVLDISIDSLARKCKEKYKVTFAEYLKRYNAIGRSSLRRAQFKSAIKGNPTLLVWLGKQYLGQSDKLEYDMPVPVIIERYDNDEKVLLSAKPHDGEIIIYEEKEGEKQND